MDITLGFLGFFLNTFPFLFALILWTLLAVKFSKSIKKNYKVYYWVFGVLGGLFTLSSVARLIGVDLPIQIMSIPVLGNIVSELSSAAYFIHPVLVIIMYMGALDPKIKWVGKLMSIRKELSIIVGFPLLAHVMKRLFGTFVQSWNYFANYEESITNPRVASVVGSNIQNFVFVLGVVMMVLFIILWVTSFDSVRRKLGSKRWKSIQRWSYVLYAMLYIHSMGINIGSIMNSNAREAQMARVEQSSAPTQREGAPQQRQQHGGEQPQGRPQSGQQQAQGSQQHGPQQQAQSSQQDGPQQQAQGGHSSHGGRPKRFSFDDIEVSRTTKAYCSSVILTLIYGSYLVMRIRKHRRDKARKQAKL
ncbi:MAG: ferric reductase-like transmembrane domain-containing protein [Rikenellaceae bacterium]